MVTVPLIIEKIIRKKVFPKIQNNRMRLLLQMPVISKKVREMICQEVIKAFGGQLYEVIIGGAALNQEIEKLLHDIGFRYTVGYGATECAPIITYNDWKDRKPMLPASSQPEVSAVCSLHSRRAEAMVA